MNYVHILYRDIHGEDFRSNVIVWSTDKYLTRDEAVLSVSKEVRVGESYSCYSEGTWEYDEYVKMRDAGKNSIEIASVIEPTFFDEEP